jgi:hypothetical protein
MPLTRQTHSSSDPFTDAPLRHPNIAPPNLRAAAASSHHVLRSNASTASSRSRQQQTNLFAPPLSRKPASRRATPSFEEDVLADEVEEDATELGAVLQQHQRRQLRHARARHGSPEGKLARAQQKARLEREREEEAEFVIRRSDGDFLREIDGLEGCLNAHLEAEEMAEEAEVRAVDDMHASAVRHYFTTAPAAGTRASEKHERSELDRCPCDREHEADYPLKAFEEYFPPVTSRVRQQFLLKLESERWRYEPVSAY